MYLPIPTQTSDLIQFIIGLALLPFVALTAEEIVWVLKARFDQFSRGMNKAERDAQKSSKGIISSFKGISTAVKAFIGGVVVQQIGRGIASLASMADQSRVVGLSFNRLAKGINQDSSRILSAIRTGVGGAVSDLELMRKTNAAILLGIPATAQGLEEMGRVATRLSRAMGIDVNFALESLITGIGRQSKLWLDNLGILVDVEGANKMMAASLGKTVEELTDAEKKLGFYNAAMDAARKKSEELGEIAPSVSEKWDRVISRLSNAAVVLAEKLNPVVSATTSALSGLAGELERIAGIRNLDPVSRAVEGKTIDALRATSAAMRVRGQADQASAIDAMIRQLQDNNFKDVVDALTKATAKPDPNLQTRIAALLFAGEGMDLGTPQIRGREVLNNVIPSNSDLKFNPSKEDFERQYQLDKLKQAIEDAFAAGPQRLEEEMLMSLRNIESNARMAGFSNAGFGGLMNFATSVSNVRRVFPADPKRPGAFDMVGEDVAESFEKSGFLSGLAENTKFFARSIEQFSAVGAAFFAGVQLFESAVNFFNGKSDADYTPDENIRRLLNLQGLGEAGLEGQFRGESYALQEVNSILSVIRGDVRRRVDRGELTQEQANRLFEAFRSTGSLSDFISRELLPQNILDPTPDAYQAITGGGLSSGSSVGSISRISESQADILVSQTATLVANSNSMVTLTRRMDGRLANIEINTAVNRGVRYKTFLGA